MTFTDDPRNEQCVQCGDDAIGYSGFCHLCHESAEAAALVTPKIVELTEQDIGETNAR